MRRSTAFLLALALAVVAHGSASAAVWRVPLGNSANAGSGSFLTALPGDRVLAVTSQGLFAYDAQGRRVWEKRTLPVQRGRPAAYTPVVGPDRLLYLVGPKRTVVVRPADGSRVAAYDSRPVLEGRHWIRRVVVLVHGGERAVASFGDGVWASQARVLPPAAAVASDGSVSLTAGYVAAVDAAGPDALGPDVVYASVDPYVAQRCTGPAHPVAATLLVAFDPATGACRWRAPTARGDLLADTRGVVVREWADGSSALTAYSPDGEVRWRHVAPGIRPRFLAQGLVVASTDRGFLAIDGLTGRALPWRTAPRPPRDRRVLRAGVVSRRTLFLMWNGGHVRSAPLPPRPA